MTGVGLVRYQSSSVVLAPSLWRGALTAGNSFKLLLGMLEAGSRYADVDPDMLRMVKEKTVKMRMKMMMTKVVVVMAMMMKQMPMMKMATRKMRVRVVRWWGWERQE